MARQYGKVFCTIWDDRDFLALAPMARLLYLALVSQHDITPAGVLTIATRRWRKFVDGTAETVDVSLAELAAARFVMVDDDNAELWVRTFMQYDGRLENPKLRASISTAITQIRSRTLQSLASSEFERKTPGGLPIEGQSDFERLPSRVARAGDSSIQSLEPVPSSSSSPGAIGNGDRFTSVVAAIVDRRIEAHPPRTNPTKHRATIELDVLARCTDAINTALRVHPDGNPTLLAIDIDQGRIQ